MNAPLDASVASPSAQAGPSRTALDWIDRLIAIPSVSRDSNLGVIEAARDHLARLGARPHLVYDQHEKKANLFARIDAMREFSPAFDRQMRYIEFGLGEKDGPLGRIAAYQYIFFGERFYDSDLAKDVLKEQSR